MLLNACSPSNSKESESTKKAPVFKQEIFYPKNHSQFDFRTINHDKPVLLVFWATWCSSCKQEIPELNQLASIYQGKIEIASVNVQEEAETVDDFLSRTKVDFPVLLDPEGKLANLFEVTGLPSVLLLAKGGEILYYGFRLPDREKLESVLTV